MTKSTERKIKNQYVIFFEKKDWSIFKDAADYYFETAAKIMKKDILYGSKDLKLLRRNVIKRLFIGIGCELLLKAIYLKNGFCINKHEQQHERSNLFEIVNINKNDFKDDETLPLNQLIEKLSTIENFGEDKNIVEKGLKISKVFRNKEGHSVVYWQDYDAQNYRDVEKSLICIYKNSFNEELQLTFSVGAGEKAIFIISKIG